MAVSRLNTYGMLEAWRAEMDVNEWHFAQITGTGANAPLNVPGQFPWVQPEREQVANGINKALDLAIPQIGFYPRPTWLSETITLNRHTPARVQHLITKWRYLDAIGVRAVTPLAAELTPAAVVYSDPYSEGVNTLATITVTVPAGTLPAEVNVFFTPADSRGEAADERWQIEPVSVTVVGTTATITGRRSLFVNPALWRVPYTGQMTSGGWVAKNVGSISNAAHFVTQVDVYRVYASSEGAVTLKCRQGCCSDTNPWDSYSAGAYIIDAEAGIIGLSGCDTCGCGGRLTYAEVFYRAGFPLGGASGVVDGSISMGLVHLANAKMVTPIGPQDIQANRWYNDKAFYSPNDLQGEDLRNPFGMQYGALEAWHTLRPHVRTKARALSARW